MQAAPDDGHAYIVRWYQRSTYSRRKNRLAGVIKIGIPEPDQNFSGFISNDCVGRAVVSDVNVRKLIEHPLPAHAVDDGSARQHDRLQMRCLRGWQARVTCDITNA